MAESKVAVYGSIGANVGVPIFGVGGGISFYEGVPHVLDAPEQPAQ